MTSVLSQPHFHNEAAAYARLEAIVWPNGPRCPRCNGIDRITKVIGARIGLRRCGPCKREFTVKVGTVFESSHVPLHLWFQAAHLMSSSKKGISAHQLHRTLNVTYKTAWFIEHRIREAMRLLLEDQGALGGGGKTVEIDETYVGGKRNLNGIGSTDIDFDIGEPIRLTPRIAHTAVEAIERKPDADLYAFEHAREELGSIEGTLAQLASHWNQPAIRIVDRRTQSYVWCRLSAGLLKTFEDKTTFEDVWNHRLVRIRGRIKYDAAGCIEYVLATDIQKLEEKAVSLDEIRDPEFTGGISISEYLDRFRDGSLG